MQVQQAFDDVNIDIKRSMQLVQSLDERATETVKLLNEELEQRKWELPEKENDNNERDKENGDCNGEGNEKDERDNRNHNSQSSSIKKTIANYKQQVLVLRRNTLQETRTLHRRISELYSQLGNLLGDERASELEAGEHEHDHEEITTTNAQAAEEAAAPDIAPELSTPKSVTESTTDQSTETATTTSSPFAITTAPVGIEETKKLLEQVAADGTSNGNGNGHSNGTMDLEPEETKKRKSETAELDEDVENENENENENETMQKRGRGRPRKRRRKSSLKWTRHKQHKPAEPKYCICNDVYYGKMIGCDNDDCKKEWFHYDCVGLKRAPKGKWFCPDCRDN